MKGLLHRLFWACQAPSRAAFDRTLDRAEAAQRAVLDEVLAQAQGSGYGRLFKGVRRAEDYQRAAPLVDYEDLRPWIERARAGEADQLFKGLATAFLPTGASSGGAKWIPYTALLQRQFRRGLGPWLFDLYRRYPGLRQGSAYWAVSPPVDGGFDSDAAYVGGLARPLLRGVLTAPAKVGLGSGWKSFRKATLDCLRAAPDLSFISVWNPSFLTMLLEGMGPEEISAAWPRLALVSCWGDAHAAGALAELRRLLPASVAIQPKGLLATEGFVTLPYSGRTVLSLNSHFFEFQTEDGVCRFAWQLEVGRDYSVVLSTGGGLYRYRLRDRVCLEGWLHGAPCLRFLGKEDRVSDLRGEKLEEAFVARCLDQIRPVGQEPGFSMLAPAPTSDRYVLYVEGPAAPRLALDLEQRLAENFHYDLCRKLGQLGPLRVQGVPAGASGRYLAWSGENGQRFGVVKSLALETRSSVGSVLEASRYP